MQRSQISKICLFSLTMSLIGITGQSFYQNQIKKLETDVGQVVLNGVSGIQITSQKMAAIDYGVTQITVTYKLMPVYHDDTHFNTYLEWSDGGDTSWGEDKQPTDYVTYDFQEDNQKIIFTCSQAFAQQIQFTMVDINNSNTKAFITIDYVIKQISDPAAEMVSTQYEIDKAFAFNFTYPTFTIGSKGSDELKDFTVESEFNSDSSKEMVDTIPEIKLNINTPDYTHIWYKKTKYTIEEGRKAMAAAVYDYLSSLVVVNSTETFSSDKLKDLMYYTIYAYRTYVGAFDTTTGTGDGAATYNLLGKFVSKYNELAAKGTGLKAIMKYDGTMVSEVMLTMGFQCNPVTEIVTDSTGIEF